jgi:signal transduction histidine kinase
MSSDRREHRVPLHHHVWQDGRHLARRAWHNRADTVVPDRLPRLWRHPPLGYLVAVFAQLAAVSLALQLHPVFSHAFTYRALSFLVMVLVALRWGTGPSLLSTLVGAGLFIYLLLRPYAAWSLEPPQVVATLVFLSVGLSISILASRTERARRIAQVATARYAQIYASERQQREKTETAVRMRDDILNLATHDLRSPATSVLSRAQLVQLRLHQGLALDAAWLDAQMQAIGDAIARLNATIDEMSDVARLQVGQALDLQLEDLDVGALVRVVAAEYSTEEGAPRVDVHAPTEAVLVCGDRARLGRVLHNLIGNAVKYSPPGAPIDVDVQAQEQQAVIIVRDRGVGIPPEELPSIFTRFFRASTSRGVKGTGIGLAGSKAIIEQHHGQITVQSVVGQGTTVTVCLPRSTDEKNRRCPIDTVVQEHGSVTLHRPVALQAVSQRSGRIGQG